MRAWLSGVLRADVLAYFLGINPRALCVNVYLKVLGDSVNEVPEVGPHFDHNQILLCLLARPAVHLRNQVELLECEDSGKV